MTMLKKIKLKSKILLIILFFFTACIFSALLFYLFYLKNFKNINYVIEPFNLNQNGSEEIFTSKLKYPKDLNSLPENFNEVIQKNNLKISNSNLVELLRNGQTVVESEKVISLKELTLNLSNSETPFIVNDQLLSLYFFSQLNIAKKEFFNKEIQDKLLKVLEDFNLRNRLLRNFGLINAQDSKIISNTPLVCKESNLEENLQNCIQYINNIDDKFFAFLNTNQREYLGRIKFIYSILNNQLLTLDTKLSQDDRLAIQNYLSDNKTSINDSELTSPDLQNIEIKYNLSDGLFSELAQYTSYLQNNFKRITYENKTISSLSKQIQNIDTLEKGNAVFLKSEDFNPYFSKLLISVLEENGVNRIGISPIFQNTKINSNINDNNISEDYDVPPLPIIAGRFRIPILMYHHIGTTQNVSHQGLYVSPEIFEKQVAYLVKKNYKIIDTNELSTILLSGKQPSQKTIMITFDDSSPSHYSAAFPILKKYKQKGVFFVIATRSFLSVAQLKEMSDAGMDIQSHSSTHVDFSKTTSERIATEIRSSKAILEGVTGKPVRALAFPGCLGDSRAFELLGSSGYTTAYSCGKHIDIAYNNRFYISRVHVFDDMDSFTKMISVGL